MLQPKHPPISGQSYLEHVIHFIRDTRWSQLPQPVKHQARRCLLDAMGALLAGAVTPAGHLVSDISRTQFPGDQATILLHGHRVSASGAALANGFSGNALDVDDGYRMVKGHPGACVLPVILAAAETIPECSGTDFLNALVIGYEIGIRSGRIRHATSADYHSSGSWGAIAGAAAGGKLINLDDQSLLHALGTAEYHAPIAPMMKGIQTPSMCKDSIGWGTLVAMLSILMARNGFVGITPFFTDTPEADWILGLGHDWQICQLYFKPYTACRWAQPAVDGALHIQKKFNLAVEAIRFVRIKSFKAACALRCQPPTNTEEAQYNMAFPVAAALVDGEVGPAQVLPPRIFDPTILQLLAKISTEIDADIEAVFPAKTFAEVIIETMDGRILSSGWVAPRWEPPDTLPTDHELEAKFLWLTSPVLGEIASKKLMDFIWHFDAATRVSDLIALCCPEKNQAHLQ
jgi:2-methylcitrate dehydratase PrpD